MFGRILHRMILWELTKVFLMSLFGITGILLLAGIVAEASQQGLGPGQVKPEPGLAFDDDSTNPGQIAVEKIDFLATDFKPAAAIDPRPPSADGRQGAARRMIHDGRKRGDEFVNVGRRVWLVIEAKIVIGIRPGRAARPYRAAPGWRQWCWPWARWGWPSGLRASCCTRGTARRGRSPAARGCSSR